MKYYFDTCIYRDFYENRIGINKRPLGKYAAKLIIKLIKSNNVLLFSEINVRELKSDFKEEEINNIFMILDAAKIIKKVDFNEKDYKEAKHIALTRNLPHGDVLHAIIARNNKAILVTQDKHFNELKDIVIVKKPEDLI